MTFYIGLPFDDYHKVLHGHMTLEKDHKKYLVAHKSCLTTLSNYFYVKEIHFLDDFNFPTSHCFFPPEILRRDIIVNIRPDLFISPSATCYVIFWEPVEKWEECFRSGWKPDFNQVSDIDILLKGLSACEWSYEHGWKPTLFLTNLTILSQIFLFHRESKELFEFCIRIGWHPWLHNIQGTLLLGIDVLYEFLKDKTELQKVSTLWMITILPLDTLDWCVQASWEPCWNQVKTHDLINLPLKKLIWCEKHGFNPLKGTVINVQTNNVNPNLLKLECWVQWWLDHGIVFIYN